jgi:N-acyl-D-amino-acid deacylase
MPSWALAAPTIDAGGGGNDSPAFSRPGAFEGAREHLKRRWSEPDTRRRIERDIEWMVSLQGGPERVVVTDYPDKSVVGKTLADLSREWRATVPEVVVRLQQEGYPDVRAGARMRGHGVNELDIENYIRMDYTAMASDAAVSGVTGVPGFEGGPGAHPRHFGAFVRKIARYVKDREVISLPFAVRSATSLPAQIVGLADRGQIRKGWKADLMVFDFERLRDRATILEPSLPSEGVDYVVVNGQLAIERGRPTGVLAGAVIRKARRGASD